jgi:hypothetical protein
MRQWDSACPMAPTPSPMPLRRGSVPLRLLPGSSRGSSRAVSWTAFSCPSTERLTRRAPGGLVPDRPPPSKSEIDFRFPATRAVPSRGHDVPAPQIRNRFPRSHGPPWERPSWTLRVLPRPPPRSWNSFRDNTLRRDGRDFANSWCVSVNRLPFARHEGRPVPRRRRPRPSNPKSISDLRGLLAKDLAGALPADTSPTGPRPSNRKSISDLAVLVAKDLGVSPRPALGVRVCQQRRTACSAATRSAAHWNQALLPCATLSGFKVGVPPSLAAAVLSCSFRVPRSLPPCGERASRPARECRDKKRGCRAIMARHFLARIP